MIPNKIRSYFKATRKKADGENTLISGILTCCNAHEFEVRVVGEVECNLFSGMQLYPDGESIALDVRCKKCGKNIPVFHSDADGYEQNNTNSNKHLLTKPVLCNTCVGSSFSVELMYEYPDYQELVDLNIAEKDNAFTWIWATLECNQCGRRHTNFINFETA